jgi:hypothetical protein
MAGNDYRVCRMQTLSKNNSDKMKGRSATSFGLAVAIALVSALASFAEPAYGQRPDPRYQTRTSDCRHEPPPGRALVVRRADSGIITRGYLSERVLTQSADARLLKGGELLICTEYGRVEIVDSDDGQVRLQIRMEGFGEGSALPAEAAKRVLDETTLHAFMTASQGGSWFESVSDLRIALVEDPAFMHKVQVIMIESASVTRQDVLDRFVLEGEEMPRGKLRVVWSEASGAEVWESPVYEAFIRAVHKANLKLPREQRVRVLAGDNPKQSNRGRFIREAVAREILDKGLKGLTIYGARHCENRAMGYPGEIGDRYPGKIWSAFQFYNVGEGRRVFGLGDAPALIPITGTDKAKLPIGKIFFMGQHNDPSTLGDMANAVAYFGSVKDVKVRPEQ